MTDFLDDPAPVPGGDAPAVRVVGAAIVQDGACLVAQRHQHMAEPLKWEFPGGKVEPGETPAQALVREIREELALEVEVGAFLGRGTGMNGGRRIELDVYAATLRSGTLRLAEHRQVRWIRAAEIEALDWAAADRPVLSQLHRLLD